MNQQTAFFEKVLLDNTDRIYRICRIYEQPPLQAKDLFQEVVFNIWKSIGNFKEQAEISTWVYRIALNVCMRSKLTLEKRNQKTFSLESIKFEARAENGGEEEEERYRALHECIADLKESDQSIVILYLEELSYKEISTITGLSENHIAVKMKRIRQKLFECISPKIN